MFHPAFCLPHFDSFYKLLGIAKAMMLLAVNGSQQKTES